MTDVSGYLKAHVPTVVLTGRSRWGIAALVAIALIALYILLRPSSAPETILVEPGEFVQQVSLSGKVIAAQDVDLGFAMGGRVTRVYVAVGDRVSAGQTLAEVENGDLAAALSQRAAARASQEAKLDALIAGPRPESIAVAEASLAQAKQALVNALQSAYATVDDAARNKGGQIFNTPRTSPPTIVFDTGSIGLETQILNGWKDAEATLATWRLSVVSLSSQSDLEAGVRNAQTTMAAVSTFLADANTGLNVAKPTSHAPTATLDALITVVGAGRTAVAGAASAVTNAQTALVSAQQSLTLAKAGATAEDVAAARALVRAAAADVDSARALLAKTRIEAPFSGIVTRVDAKRGMIASVNDPLVSLASDGTFQIEGYVPEINVALVRPGASSTVTLDAYGAGTVFEAVVVSVDPAETERDGVATYRVVLQFSDADERILSGMTANIAIFASTRQGVLSVPVGVVERDGTSSYVTVYADGAEERRRVETGAVSSRGDVEILAGLSAGEHIIVPQ
jgi:RND family efflux transporter MFP subunit